MMSYGYPKPQIDFTRIFDDVPYTEAWYQDLLEEILEENNLSNVEWAELHEHQKGMLWVQHYITHIEDKEISWWQKMINWFGERQ